MDLQLGFINGRSRKSVKSSEQEARDWFFFLKEKGILGDECGILDNEDSIEEGDHRQDESDRNMYVKDFTIHEERRNGMNKFRILRILHFLFYKEFDKV